MAAEREGAAGACREAARLAEADHIGSACEQLTPGEAGRVFQRAQRAAAIAAVEIVPVAGVLALERDDAASRCLRGAAPLMLASRHSSPTRRPFGNSRGTQVSAVARSRATMASRS